MAIDTTIQRSRRTVLAGAFGGLAAVAAQAFRPLAVRAEGEVIHVGDDHLTATTATWLKNTTTNNDVIRGETTKLGRGVYGISVGGVGVEGISSSGKAGVYGTNGAGGTGVRGDSHNGYGVYGTSSLGDAGVGGFSDQGYGVVGLSNLGAGVAGQSIEAPGVRAESLAGRGGVFIGKKAQIKLTPATAATHPVVGQAGDLFVDKSARLWFCKKGGNPAVWKQVSLV